jgi:alkylation response protein AidB-like acyl-CoA dehydrogenase
VCIVRTEPQAEGSRGLSGLIVPRGTAGIRYEQPISKSGHRICQNNSVVFSNCRVPEENAFAVGNGDLVVNKAFTWSGPVAAIASVGVTRSAYEYALAWAKKYTGGGDRPIINHQIVAYTLAEVAMKVEAGRAFAWKAAHYHDLHNADGHAIGPMAKVFCSEMLFTAVFQAMKVVGVNALDRSHPLERYLREASVFPLYDAGNIGMQMRKICAVMAEPDFDPRAIAGSIATPFGKKAPPPEIQTVGRNLKRQA